MTLREFLFKHSSRELTEIIARDRIDPYDLAGRLELGFAKLASLIYSAHRDRNSDPMDSSDFMPQWGKAIREEASLPTLEELRARGRAAFGN